MRTPGSPISWEHTSGAILDHCTRPVREFETSCPQATWSTLCTLLLVNPKEPGPFSSTPLFLRSKRMCTSRHPAHMHSALCASWLMKLEAGYPQPKTETPTIPYKPWPWTSVDIENHCSWNSAHPAVHWLMRLESTSAILSMRGTGCL